MSWLLSTVLQWTLGYTCLVQFWFPRCVCPAVGLLSCMVVSHSKTTESSVSWENWMWKDFSVIREVILTCFIIYLKIRRLKYSTHVPLLFTKKEWAIPVVKSESVGLTWLFNLLSSIKTWFYLCYISIFTLIGESVTPSQINFQASL